MIPVTQPSLPKRRILDRYLDNIFDSHRLTNNGPLVRELTNRLESYLGVSNLLLLTSGTLALQIAYRAVGIRAEETNKQPEAITTPFTFVATESSLSWERIKPIFADINPASLTLCPDKAASEVVTNTKAIVPVHVYGNPCDVESFARIAAQNELKIVYDAAHAFGVRYQDQSVLNWGDASVLSFHATKLFHTVEGGGIVFRDSDSLEQATEIINFGLGTGTSIVNRVGINAKMSEVHAAFGLALLDDIDAIIEHRLALSECYAENLPTTLQRPVWNAAASKTAAYMPIIFDSNSDRDECERALHDADIETRRYFAPCLGNEQDWRRLSTAKLVSERILCLPLFSEMTFEQVTKVARIVSATR